MIAALQSTVEIGLGRSSVLADFAKTPQQGKVGKNASRFRLPSSRWITSGCPTIREAGILALC